MSITLLEGLVPLLLPFAVKVIVRLAGQVPKWIVPAVLVPLLGAGGQAAAAYAAGAALDPMLGVVLGAIGLALREAADQLGKAAKAIAKGRQMPRVAP